MKQIKNLLELYKSLGNLKYDFRNYNLNKLILSRIKGKSIIDIGCGSGFLLSRIKGKKCLVVPTITLKEHWEQFFKWNWTTAKKF